jgi:hypothetical protein
VAAKLHLAEDALALHLFLERLEGLVDVVVSDENLHASFLLDRLRLSGNIYPRAADAPLPSVGGPLPELRRKVHAVGAFTQG